VNREDLRRILRSRGVDPARYSLDGGLAHDTTCLEYRHKKKWCVYYTERGYRFDERCFDTEEEACEDLLARIFP